MSSMKERILETGRYLNVIKNYDKSSHSPHSHELIENHEVYLQRQ